MSRALAWMVTTALVAVSVASYSEINRLKGRIGSLEHRQYHVHADVREFMIRAALAEADRPIVVLGDSITEMAPLPKVLCGHPVINAGIGGLSTEGAIKELPRIFSIRRPTMVVIALGANDVGSTSETRDLGNLLRAAMNLSARVISIAVTSDAEIDRQISGAAASAEVPYIVPPIDPSLKMSDGIHYTGAAYRIWVPALEAAVNAQCG